MQVPSRDKDKSPEDALRHFLDDIPVLDLIGTKHRVSVNEPYVVDDDVQLVCKYLKAYKYVEDGCRRIDKLYKEREY